MKKTVYAILMAVGIPTLSFAERLIVAVNPGPAYKNRAPQMAVWIETSDGAFVDTLFVTKKASGNKWIGSPKNGRPESLPDWYKAKGQNPAGKISKENLDATTSATPKKGTVIVKELSLEKGKTYALKCQANQSFDYNDYYTKEKTGVDGQPAVLYIGEITPDGTEQEIMLKLTSNSSYLTTADKILESIFVVVK